MIRKLLQRLAHRLGPPEPFMVIEEVERYNDEIVSMVSNRGELWIAMRSGKIFRIKDYWW